MLLRKPTARSTRGIPGAFRLLDISLGLLTVGYGVYEKSFLWGLLGFAGLGLGVLNFSGGAWAFILKRFDQSSKVSPPSPAGFPLPPSTPYAPGPLEPHSL